MRRIEELFQLYVEFLTWSFLKPALTTINSETSLMRPPSGPTIGGLIKEVAVLLKTLLMQTGVISEGFKQFTAKK